MTITNIIKVERLKRGWTQAQLAEICGLSERTIQRLENGGEASNESINALAAVFKIDLEKLKAKPLRIHFSAPMSKSLMISSCLICAFLMGNELYFSGSLRFTIPLLLFLYVLCSVKGYSIKHNNLLIHHIGWSSRYPLENLTQIQVNPQAMLGSIRLFGVDLLFAAVGYFKNGILGKYRAYATNSANALVLKFNEKVLVITPDDPTQMQASLEDAVKNLKSG